MPQTVGRQPPPEKAFCVFAEIFRVRVIADVFPVIVRHKQICSVHIHQLPLLFKFFNSTAHVQQFVLHINRSFRHFGFCCADLPDLPGEGFGNGYLPGAQIDIRIIQGDGLADPEPREDQKLGEQLPPFDLHSGKQLVDLFVFQVLFCIPYTGGRHPLPLDPVEICRVIHIPGAVGPAHEGLITGQSLVKCNVITCI